MDDNPYQSPQSPGTKLAEPKPSTWHPSTQFAVGFAAGVVLAAPFVVRDMTADLLIYGGIITGIFGVAYGILRRI